jgi:hypothetical protein
MTMPSRTYRSRRPHPAEEPPPGGMPIREELDRPTRTAPAAQPQHTSRDVSRAEVTLASELRITGIANAFIVENLMLAFDAIEPLLDVPRSRWSTETDDWTRLCVSLALAHRRLEGGATTRARARTSLREAVQRAVASGGRSLDRIRESEEFA